MNQTISSVKLMQGLLLACYILGSVPAAADGVAVVPGKTNGYFYDLSSNQPADGKEISLIVKKTGHFKEYTIETADALLRCDQACPETSQRLPAGSVSLKIIGKKPVSFIDIPLLGKWSEPCNNTQTDTDECVFSLNELNGSVSVEVSPDIEVGTTLALPEGGEGLIVKVDTRGGYILLAGHEQLGEGRTWLDFDPSDPMKHKVLETSVNSPLDGRINMPKLLELGSEAARYCERMGRDWYLPAANELGLMSQSAMEKVQGLDVSDDGDRNFVWSSTKHGKGFFVDNKTGPRIEVKAWNNKSARIDGGKYVYEYDLKNKKLTYLRKYQVLCFRRLVF